MTDQAGQDASPGTQGSERRRHARLDQQLDIGLRVVGGPMAMDIEERPAQARNSSLGGLLIATDFPIVPETLLELKIPNSEFGYINTLNGKVCWRRERAPSGTYEEGVSFVRLKTSKLTAAAVPKTSKGPVLVEPPAPHKPTVLRAPPADPKKPAENRRSPRFPRSLLVKVRSIQKEVIDEEVEYSALMLDSSHAGAAISCSREYPIGSLMQVRVPKDPEGSGGSRLGRVVWTRPGDIVGKTLIGISFPPS